MQRFQARQVAEIVRFGGLMNTMARCVLVLLFWLCIPASQVSAEDAAEANRLMVEAIRLVDAAHEEPSADGKMALLQRAHDNLTAIVERHPSTDLAVRLASGQRIGTVSLASVRRALDELRQARPARSGAPLQAWRHGGGLSLASFLGEGRRVLTVGTGGAVTVRDITGGATLRAWEHGSRIAAAAVSRDARRLLTAGADRNTVLHDIRTGRFLEEWSTRRAPSAIALSRNGRHALVGLASTAYLIDVESLAIIHRWEHGAPAASVALSPDGRRASMGFVDGRVKLGDVRTGETLGSWEIRGAAGGGVVAAAFSGDGRQVVVGTASGQVELRDVQAGNVLRAWDVGYGVRVTALAHASNRSWVLAGDEGRKVRLLDAGTGRTLREWEYDARPSALAISADGQRVIMGFGDGAAIVCDIVLPKRGDRNRTFLTSDGGCW